MFDALPDGDKGRRRSGSRTSCTASTGRFSRQSGWSNSVWTVLSSVHRSRPRRRRRISAQITTIPSQLRGAMIRVDSKTMIVPAGGGISELTGLRISGETVERISITAADLPRRIGFLPEGLKCLNVRGPEVTEPRWPEWDEYGLSVSLQGVAADTISYLTDLGRRVTRLEIYGEQRQHGQAADIRAQGMADTELRCAVVAPGEGCDT
ncbi:uncharacterized protein LOC122386438 [Amphibalanus amphitrite]|uniref:uncharacterized protein LOC122386438 n=1 Tax=Amphibalanus amphitrite TaxID=1232801 RepID=UPI001C920EDA|nr:uncharacterized protein LOC122386438 [Amphibalanus amphitrite]